MHLPLRNRHVLLRLEVKLRRIRVAPSNPLHGTRVGLNVDDIPDRDPLLLDALVDARIKTELLSTLTGLETDNDVGNSLAVATEGVFGFLGGQICYFAFVDFFSFFYAEACGC